MDIEVGSFWRGRGAENVESIFKLTSDIFHERMEKEERKVRRGEGTRRPIGRTNPFLAKVRDHKNVPSHGFDGLDCEERGSV